MCVCMVVVGGGGGGGGGESLMEGVSAVQPVNRRV